MEGMDRGECSTIDFSLYFFSLLLQKCTKKQGHAGSTGMGNVIQEGSGYGFVFHLYTCLYHWFDFFNLIKSERERANERSRGGKTYVQYPASNGPKVPGEFF